MPKTDPRVDTYIERSASFARPILRHLRQIVHAGCPEVEETIKWRFPHFDYHGIMCGMAAFKEHCSFGFWKASLIFKATTRDRDGMGHFGRITSIEDLPGEKAFVGYVRKAARLNRAGIQDEVKRARRKPRLAPPPDLVGALKKNAKARKTFENFSPTNQREYIEWLLDAKREETRKRRLKTAIEWMAQGKPHNWRYL